MAGKRIPPEHEEAIVAAYLAGATQRAAAALFGYSGNVCLNALRRRVITPRNHAEACRIPKEHEEAMIAAYLAGASSNQAAAQFGYNGQTCLNVLKRYGISARKQIEVSRRYKVDESFFDQIDTEDKAYWLGFLTADGGIVRHQIILQLQVNDTTHLEKFLATLNSDYPISSIESNLDGKGYSMSRLTINSVKLIKALAKLGVTPNKSFTVEPCQKIPLEFQKAYWRGVFDGDGSIYQYKQGKTYWELSLVGNQSMVTGFRNFIHQFVNSATVVKPHKRTVFQIKYNGSHLPRAVALVLYANATIYLDRKYILAQELINS